LQAELERHVYGFLNNCGGGGRKTIELWRRRRRRRRRRNFNFAPFNAMPYSTEKCQWFQLEHPFTCRVAGMTG